jgi:SpoVK/Ycf46/Vps4 family AAA+-type ATPase
LEKTDSGDNKKENNTESQLFTKKYIYKISKKGKENIQCINLFLEKIVKEYTDEILNKSTQMVFEYQKLIKDDDDRTISVFNETPFKTNKSFDNIFFEGKSEFIEYISQFSLTQNKGERKSIQAKYERVGIPYKSVILLHGYPGCGKTSLIKSTIAYTGRHCILVSWSKIHTSNDFISLFRPLKINNKTYYSNELILVFEDFDANHNNIIKKRKIAMEEDIHENDGMDSDASTSTLECKIKAKLMNEFKINPLYKLEDEITLDFILNVLDGIVELFDIIVFFTTNDIDIIDPALKRSGRIDRIINMKKATPSIIKEMLSHHYNLSESEMKQYDDVIDHIPPYKYSYSDISQICNYSHTIGDCLREITKI